MEDNRFALIMPIERKIRPREMVDFTPPPEAEWPPIPRPTVEELEEILNR